MRWQDYQLSRLETVFAVIVLLILLSTLLNRAVNYFTLAERALVENVVTNINAALRLEEAALLARGHMEQLQQLAETNPVSLIVAKPQNYSDMLTGKSEHKALPDNQSSTSPMTAYIGEFHSPVPSEYDRGSWYYDRQRHYLVYMVRNREMFRTSLEGPERIRFEIKLDFTDRNGNASFDPDIDQYRGIKFQSVNEYEWLL